MVNYGSVLVFTDRLGIYIKDLLIPLVISYMFMDCIGSTAQATGCPKWQDLPTLGSWFKCTPRNIKKKKNAYLIEHSLNIADGMLAESE